MIQVVGIGPGRREGRTIAADDALRRAEVIVGYTTYVAAKRNGVYRLFCFRGKAGAWR